MKKYIIVNRRCNNGIYFDDNCVMHQKYFSKIIIPKGNNLKAGDFCYGLQLIAYSRIL